MNMIKKYPVRDYLSVETGISHARHAVGMTPLSDASLRDAFVVEHSFSTERYIPTECSLMTANALKGQHSPAQGNALCYKMPIKTSALKGRNQDVALTGLNGIVRSSHRALPYAIDNTLSGCDANNHKIPYLKSHNLKSNNLKYSRNEKVNFNCSSSHDDGSSSLRRTGRK